MALRHAPSHLFTPIAAATARRVCRPVRICPLHSPLIARYNSSSSSSSPPASSSSTRPLDKYDRDTTDSAIRRAGGERDTASLDEISLPPPSTQAVHSSLGRTTFSEPESFAAATSTPTLPDSTQPSNPSVPPSLRPTPTPTYQSNSPDTMTANPKTPFTIPPHLQERLAEWSASVSRHSRNVAQEAEKQFVSLGLKVNEMTGYKEVERLKGLVFRKEDELQRLREATRAAKTAYDDAVSSRSEAQRDVNSLLERKHSWTDADVSRFTTLVRLDHTSTHAVASTSIALKDAELAVDKAFSELMQTILQRYHEEQMWSDKIRSVSTYANLIGLALNLLVFVGAIAVVEPWKRKRLVERLEERMAGMMEKVENRLGGVEGRLAASHAGYQGATTGAVEGIQTIDAVPAAAAANATPAVVGDLAMTDDIPPLSVDSQESLIAEPTSMGVDSFPIDNAATEAIPNNRYPFIKTAVEGLPPYLDPLSRPSAERDLALAGAAGAVVGAAVIGLGRALAGR